MQGKKIGYGIIGCGAIADINCQAIENIENARLVAVSDINKENAEKLSQKYGAGYTTDYIEMLKRTEIDAVILCIPSGLHGKVTEDCAGYGKHVLTEKPLETTGEKMDRMIKVCRENNVLLGCILQSRYMTDVKRLYEYLSQGKLGRLILGDAKIKWYRTPEYYKESWKGWKGSKDLDGGGALINQSIHTIDLLQWFMGPVESIYAQTDRLLHEYIEGEDTAIVNIRFKSGALGLIEASTAVYPGFPSKLELTGTEGTVALEDGKVKKLYSKNGEEWKVDTEGEQKGFGGANDPIADKNFIDHQHEIEDFTYAILNGNDSFWLGGEESRKAVDIIRAAYESASTGKPVFL